MSRKKRRNPHGKIAIPSSNGSFQFMCQVAHSVRQVVTEKARTRYLSEGQQAANNEEMKRYLLGLTVDCIFGLFVTCKSIAREAGIDDNTLDKMLRSVECEWQEESSNNGRPAN